MENPCTLEMWGWRRALQTMGSKKGYKTTRNIIDSANQTLSLNLFSHLNQSQIELLSTLPPLEGNDSSLSHDINSGITKQICFQRCVNGFDRLARFRKPQVLNDHPHLFDSFGKDGFFVLILNIRSYYCPSCSQRMLKQYSWSCRFYLQNDNTSVVDLYDFHLCPHLETMILKFKLPDHLDLKALHVASVVGVHESPALNPIVSFNFIEFCLIPPLANEIKLAACTMVKSEYQRTSDFLPEWIAFHYLQGFSHFYIFPDEDPSHLSIKLQSLINQNIVTIMDFMWPYAGYNNQQSQQNSCVYRMQGRVTG